MNGNLKDILSNRNKDIDNQKLMDYLHQQLSKADSHEIEKSMNDDAFVSDAVEGLQNFDTKKDMQAYVADLHNDLQKQLVKKKNRKDKRKLKEQPWIYLAIIIVLILLVLCFVVMKKYL